MKTIITGATGRYGQRAAELLLKKILPSELIFTSRRPDKLTAFAEQGVTVRYSDFDKPESLPDAWCLPVSDLKMINWDGMKTHLIPCIGQRFHLVRNISK